MPYAGPQDVLTAPGTHGTLTRQFAKGDGERATR